jgi:alanyl-tRNA synthetase
LFGEKYGDEVRVVTMGEIEDAEHHERTYSIELCGGTHVHRTGDIGLITIVGDSAVAAGVRRIEAKTRDEARKWLEADARGYADLTALLRAPAGEAAQRLEALIDNKRKLERELADAKRKLAMGGGLMLDVSNSSPSAGASISQVGGNSPSEIAGVKTMFRSVQGLDAKDLKPMADDAKANLGSGVVAIANTGLDGKASLVVAVTADLTSRFNAVELVRLGSAALGGKGGGGRPDMAQAGGPDGAKTHEALAAVEEGVRRAAGA